MTDFAKLRAAAEKEKAEGELRPGTRPGAMVVSPLEVLELLDRVQKAEARVAELKGANRDLLVHIYMLLFAKKEHIFMNKEQAAAPSCRLCYIAGKNDEHAPCDLTLVYVEAQRTRVVCCATGDCEKCQ